MRNNPRKFAENASEGFFGSKLDSEAPIIVCDCISFLRHRGLQEVGIFRIPGNADVVIALKEKYNESFASKKSKDRSETSILNEFRPIPNVSDVASLLKAYFKDLSNSLIPEEITETMIDAIKHKKGDIEDLSFELSRAVKSIPSPNRECLSFMVSFWREICVFKKYNNMGPSNISTCFVLSIMGHGNSVDQLQVLGNGAAVIQALISLPVKLFMPEITTVQNNTKYRDTQYATHMKISELQRQYKENKAITEGQGRSGTTLRQKMSRKKSLHSDTVSKSKTKLYKQKKKKGKKGNDYNYKANGTRIMQKPMMVSEIVNTSSEEPDMEFDLSKYTKNELNKGLPPPPVFESMKKTQRESEEIPPPPLFEDDPKYYKV